MLAVVLEGVTQQLNTVSQSVVLDVAVTQSMFQLATFWCSFPSQPSTNHCNFGSELCCNPVEINVRQCVASSS